MAAQRTTAILISPHKAGEKQGLLQVLSIDKNSKPPAYETLPLDSRSLLGNFGRLPDPLLKALTAFSETHLSKTLAAVKQYFEVQKGTLSYREFQEKELIKHHYDLLRAVKPHFNTIKWYHSRRGPNDRWLTAPCALSTYRPSLQFEVQQSGEGYCLEGFAEINGACYSLRELERHYFFLRKDQEYFLLSLADHHTLEELSKTNGLQPGNEAHVKTQLLLLEEKYPVKQDLLRSSQTITAEPVPGVLLSELSNTFLMLTPQWSYDGYTVENPWEQETAILQNGERIIIRRNREKENELILLLESFHPRFPDQHKGYYYLSFSDAQKRQWFPKTYHQLLLSGVELKGMDLLQHFRYSSHLPETEMELIRESGQQLIYHFSVRFGKEKIALSELQKLLWAGQNAVLLKDGTLGLLNEEWMERYATSVKHAKVNKQELAVPRWLGFSLQEAGDTDTAFSDTNTREWWQHWQQWQKETIVYPLPRLLQASLRPYQQKGYEWMCLMADAGAGGCLADDMGLGKTLQAIAFLARAIEKQPGMQSLVICPASLVYNWEQELKKFAPALSVTVYHGPRKDATVIGDLQQQVIISSYGTLRSEEEKFNAQSYLTVFIDESHNIKNPAAKITRAAGNIRSVYCFALSGTPVVNNTFDLYAQLNTALPGLLGTREFFKREYADAIDRYGDDIKKQRLQKLIAPFILRRTKEQVATDLPEKTEITLWCEMGEQQRELYNEVKEQIRSSLFLDIEKNGMAKAKLGVLQGILKLRQLCNAPRLLAENRNRGGDAVKMERLFEELEQVLPRHKVLVFSQFTGMLNLIAQVCDQKDIAYYHFDGQTPAARRMEMVTAFQDKNNPVGLFLISLKAGNAGITLTAADYVFLFDPWWNEAVQQQAIDRTHRIGQTKNVFAYKLICKDTIEEKITLLQQRKKQLSADLIGTDEGFIRNLEKEDLEWLFE
ncbi:DEAD/DEAH box helicase [Niabella beijingensis]|uniref:DEAD/DEAH box helicase n=1 Tax=Niabella beijingensis TaxID=2872700 RepID=UPI001CBCAA50|nr:DEAD/DEAH box helicase [Niabella beijingensis]MBZ4188175.1 DEAD/DEAH box helicase [Niabella beijingensis]